MNADWINLFLLYVSFVYREAHDVSIILMFN